MYGFPCVTEVIQNFYSTFFINNAPKSYVSITSDFVTAEEMDKADEELRETIIKLWPLQAKKHLDLLVPPNNCKFILYSSLFMKFLCIF